jgi:hypothetical protein
MGLPEYDDRSHAPSTCSQRCRGKQPIKVADNWNNVICRATNGWYISRIPKATRRLEPDALPGTDTDEELARIVG